MYPASKSLGRVLLFVVLTTAAILSLTGHMDQAVNKSGLEILTGANEQYLNEAFERSMKGFLVLSAIKSGVAVIEGSEIGIGFNLEVGDIAQSIYDYVDIAWKTSLAGGTVLLLIHLIVESVQAIDHWFLFALMLAILMFLLTKWFFPQKQRLDRLLREIVLLAAVLTLSFYLIIPVSIAGAAYLSRQITLPLVEEAQQGFEHFQEDLSPHALNERFFPGSRKEDSLWSSLDFKSKLENSKAAIVQLAEYLKEITEDFARWTIKIIAGYLFDCIVFPLALFFFVYVFTKNLVKYVIGMGRGSTNPEP